MRVRSRLLSAKAVQLLSAGRLLGDEARLVECLYMFSHMFLSGPFVLRRGDPTGDLQR